MHLNKRIKDVNRDFLLSTINNNRLFMNDLWRHNGDSIDWKWLFDTAKGNTVIGIFIHNLKESGIFERIPAKLRLAFEVEEIKAEENFDNATFTLREVTKAFRHAGIPVLVFKGGVFAEDLYDHYLNRPFFDIDLLIPKAELHRSDELLSNMDYRFYCTAKRSFDFIPLGHIPQNGPGQCFSENVTRKIYLTYHFHFPYVVSKQDRRLHIDLHWHFFNKGIAPIDEHYLWKHTKQISVGGVSVETLSDEAAAVFCAVRIAISNSWDNKLVVLSDFMRLLNRIDIGNGRDRLWCIAQEWRAQRHLKFSMDLVNRLFGFDSFRFQLNAKPVPIWSRVFFAMAFDRSIWVDLYSSSLYKKQLWYGSLLELRLGQLPRKSFRAFIRMCIHYIENKRKRLPKEPKVPQSLEGELGRNFLTFAKKNIGPIHQIEKVSLADRTNGQRCAYKLVAAKGATLKARSLIDPREADRIFVLASYLDRRHFPKVLYKFENKLLIEWVQGKPLDSSELNGQMVAEAAQIHAQLHNTILPEYLSDKAPLEGKHWLYRFKKNCDYLVKQEIITEEQGHALTALAHEHLPQRFDVGLIHRDFCPDHLMRDKEGRLKVIDLELISVSAISFDLARTVYLWPMSPSDRRVYFEAYRQIRGVEPFFDHFLFWMVLVLVESAAFRDQAGRANKEQTVDQIKAILKSVDEKNILNMYGLKWGSRENIKFAKS